MSKASIFQVINIWFSYRIPIESRRVRRDSSLGFLVLESLGTLLHTLANPSRDSSSLPCKSLGTPLHSLANPWGLPFTPLQIPRESLS